MHIKKCIDLNEYLLKYECLSQKLNKSFKLTLFRFKFVLLVLIGKIYDQDSDHNLERNGHNDMSSIFSCSQMLRVPVVMTSSLSASTASNVVNSAPTYQTIIGPGGAVIQQPVMTNQVNSRLFT